MPTTTFFNLAEEKRQKLLQAAFAEFSSKPYEEASINAIIQTAAISRGSFYQYFADKDELYFYLHCLARHQELAQLKQLASEHKGEIFATLMAYYHFSYQKYGESGTRHFYQYYFRSSKHQIWRQSLPFHQECRDDDTHCFFEQEVLPIFNVSALQMDSAAEKLAFTKFALSLVQKVIAETFIKEQSYEVGRTKLNAYFTWLKYGVYQKEDTNA